MIMLLEEKMRLLITFFMFLLLFSMDSVSMAAPREIDVISEYDSQRGLYFFVDKELARSDCRQRYQLFSDTLYNVQNKGRFSSFIDLPNVLSGIGLSLLSYDYLHPQTPSWSLGQSSSSLAGLILTSAGFATKLYTPYPKQSLLSGLLIPKDRRSPVLDTNISPFRSHGYMEMYHDDGRVYSGSGTLIGDNHVLTAGHNIFDLATNSEPSAVRFYPGRNGKNIYGQSLSKRGSFYAHEEYRNYGRGSKDVGVVVLQQKLGNGCFLEYGLDENPFCNKTAHISGYPGEKGALMYTMEGMIKYDVGGHFFYDIDTTGGQSGSGVYIVKDDGSFKCIGVHTEGLSWWQKIPFVKKYNKGVCLREDVLDFVRSKC